MPEQTANANKITSAWPVAYEAAVKALAGVGVNEDQAKRPAHRQRCEEAAREAFVTAGVEFKRVQVRITWSPKAATPAASKPATAPPLSGRPAPATGAPLARPTLDIELITMDGRRYAGGVAPGHPSREPEVAGAATPDKPVAEQLPSPPLVPQPEAAKARASKPEPK